MNMSKNEERLRDLSDSDRRPRAAPTASERTRDEARETSDDLRIAAFRQRLFQSVLPDPPSIAGYHMCWLSSENPADSIADRQALGYELVTWSEVQGWSHASANVGAQPGEVVRVREMVLAKLSERLHQEYMHIAHHEKPAHQDEAVISAIEAMNASAQRKGSSVKEDEGFEDIRSQMRRPSPFRN
jgi:hypothetical protein